MQGKLGDKEKVHAEFRRFNRRVSQIFSFKKGSRRVSRISRRVSRILASKKSAKLCVFICENLREIFMRDIFMRDIFMRESARKKKVHVCEN
jgi:hypothetical protein